MSERRELESLTSKSKTQTINVRSRLGKISIASAEALIGESKEDSFQVSAGLKELTRTATELFLKYDISISRGTSTQMELHGQATVTFSRGVSELELEESGALNSIVSSIFSDNYSAIYLLSGSLCVNPPAPGLLETARLLDGA